MEENKRREQAKADRWKEFEASPKDIESYGDNSKTDIDYASAYTFAEGETKLVNKLLSGNPNQICDAVEEIHDGEEPHKGPALVIVVEGINNGGKLSSFEGIVKSLF